MNWTILHKYLSDECTQAEKEKVEHWIRSDQRNQAFYDSLEKIWSIEPDHNIKVDAKDAWNSFREKISEEKEGEGEYASQKTLTGFQSIQSGKPGRKGYRRPVAVSIAAAMILLAGVLMYFFLPNFGATDQELAQKKSQIQEISTELGQRTSFRLADGTQVYLNADSRVQIPSTFGDSIRSVQLQGEAYFDVARDPSVPFVVYSGHSSTRVLGTRFGVKAYPQDERVQVVVEEGKVALSSSGRSAAEDLHLTANQVGLLGSDGEPQVTRVKGVSAYFAWKDGRMVFESTPFEKVIPQLERWYNVKIVTDTALYSRQVTASFSDEPMLEVINILALSLNAEFQRDGRNISFYLKNHKQVN
ncbi:FecR family protein [Fodinibius roseus]|uniref:FecR family protein n=1 Tax=Fodinibius roseus TaxID=1194090 RepID=A0A1M5EZ48_9BACT|nr:FecR domain-containing protein [Fodinibius roseus]SHF84590.1 FecR family protein [Fodinibius roseus]